MKVARHFRAGIGVGQGGSSKWLNDTVGDFGWQEGYGAFTVGVSQKSDTIAYIQSQAEHHRKHNFEEEFLAFLKKHNVDRSDIRLGIDSAVPPGLLSIAATRP
jgi:hypothetical protein